MLIQAFGSCQLRVSKCLLGPLRELKKRSEQLGYHSVNLSYAKMFGFASSLIRQLVCASHSKTRLDLCRGKSTMFHSGKLLPHDDHKAMAMKAKRWGAAKSRHILKFRRSWNTTLLFWAPHIFMASSREPFSVLSYSLPNPSHTSLSPDWGFSLEIRWRR